MCEHCRKAPNGEVVEHCIKCQLKMLRNSINKSLDRLEKQIVAIQESEAETTEISLEEAMSYCGGFTSTDAFRFIMTKDENGNNVC